MATGIAIGGFFVLLMWLTAVAANARYRRDRQLPMQWGLDGGVNSSAPRPVALAFIPALATVTIGLYVFGMGTVKPRAGDAGAVLPVLVGIGLMSFAIQLLHLWLVGRTLRRTRR